MAMFEDSAITGLVISCQIKFLKWSSTIFRDNFWTHFLSLS